MIEEPLVLFQRCCSKRLHHPLVESKYVVPDYEIRYGPVVTWKRFLLWNETTLRDTVITNSIDIPQQEPLPGDDRPIPYFIIGDNVIALNEWMMKPFAAAPLEQDERVFNHRLSRARRCVENWPIAGAANSQPFDKSRRM